MFSGMQRKALKASTELAKEYGEPEWCKGSGRRNTHLLALAPTVSNSLISGNVSPSIEPWAANVFVQKSAKGTIIQKNKTLVALLEKKDKNTDDVWKSIERENGSVQHLEFLTAEEKEVFLTARELNQFTLVKLAGQRQRWIDQGQSLNLFFPENADPRYIHEVHLMAHSEGLNSLYYLRTSSVIRGDSGSREYKRESTECKACEG
jgi:ribonucleoside-diphosphate reductase alpha chain